VCKRSSVFVLAAGVLSVSRIWAAAPVHLWQKQELTFNSARTYANPYTDVRVWVDLEGPGFHRRVYGFWDGGHTFRVRVVAEAPGRWHWTSGSAPADPGLDGRSGGFTAVPWTARQLAADPLRHGFLRPTLNGHALEFADGTPYFAVGDTWWALATHRFKWYGDDAHRPLGPQAGFKDYVRLRQAQGYNWVNMIAAFPNWADDGKPWHLVMPDGMTLRNAWLEFGSGPDDRHGSAKSMGNSGGRPFLFPGKVPGFGNVFPDMDRINPRYFQALDRKVDYLNAHGFVVFIECFRRDLSDAWKKYYAWPQSPARYMEYILARYGANAIVYSPVHLDIIEETVPVSDYDAAIDLRRREYGPPPFGTLMSADSNPSTLTNWGEHSWVTLQTIGNAREHEYYWYLTEIFRDSHPEPALNVEPYYAGYFDARGLNGGYRYGAKGGTRLDALYVRSAMYGSVLSGGLAGHVYGAEGIWGADTEPAAPTHMWDAFRWQSGAQMRYLAKFILSVGKRYRDLVPDDYVVPSRTPEVHGYVGWAYAMRTADRRVFLAYFEQGCPRSMLRGASPSAVYAARWFDPRNGKWIALGRLAADTVGQIRLPPFPGGEDWGLSLVRVR
jgi:Protein of unknown function (DUF4038)/Domain of unknown function (DUF5060)/Putative collagen-binding domain of a collagenase